jgi:hypothetical protein
MNVRKCNPKLRGQWFLLAGLWLLHSLIASAGERSPSSKHWAFRPVVRPKVPVLKEEQKSANPVDRFVLDRLRREGRRMAPQAPDHMLVRRLSLDLRGLPPSPAEVRQFNLDRDPGKWGRLVERFLASPHFGERMAQQWLDLARYGDTSGYAADRTREVWPYRDWVINAYNGNMPHDRFLVEQLAGDMLPGATPDQRLATGFHRNAMQAKGNNPRKEEFRIKTIVDRLNVTGRAVLGLTLECAECHDHKYDPISQREYYQLFAVFNNIPHLGQGYGVHGPRMNYRYIDLGRRTEFRALTSALEAMTGPVPWSVDDPQEQAARVGRWDAAAVEKDHGAFNLKGDFTIIAGIKTSAPVGNIVSKYDWRGKQRGYVFGIGGEGESSVPNGHLFAWVSARQDPFEGVEIHSSRPVADGREHQVAVVFRAGKSIKLLIDGVEDTAARVKGTPPGMIASSERFLAIGSGYSNSQTADAYRFDGQLKDIRIYRRALRIPEGSVQRREMEKKLNAISARTVSVPVMEEESKARTTHILVRGDFKQKGEEVRPGLPAILPQLPDGKQLTRLSFAEWLVSPGHPLTARVAVNYLWQHFFGLGLVSTPGDFGFQGSGPSHPELLDWLASEFASSGWDRKNLVRLIVHSMTYRQSSVAVDGLGVPGKLPVGMPRRRLEAEQIRDQALVVSGLFVPVIGGPPVFPLQPKGFYEERGQNAAGNSNFNWSNSKGDGRYRKTLYTYWKRMALHPALAALDAPPRQVCVTRRSITNTPQQALVTMNDPAFHQFALAFARRITTQEQNQTPTARIRYAFNVCLARDPDPGELEQFMEFVEKSADRQAAWVSIASVLLNLDETLTRE